MASQALTRWRNQSAVKLDELIAAHTSVGGEGRGRRYATEQINASLVVQLAAHFQLFCRDLHSETIEGLALGAPAGYRSMLRVGFATRRGLDRGNASAQTIAMDFDRFDMGIWDQVNAFSCLTAVRRVRLEQLMVWRNAIVHQDFAFSAQQEALLAGSSLTLAWIRRWRGACDGLAQTFAQVISAHVHGVTGRSPW